MGLLLTTENRWRERRFGYFLSSLLSSALFWIEVDYMCKWKTTDVTSSKSWNCCIPGDGIDILKTVVVQHLFFIILSCSI